MNLQHLEYFISVSRTENFSASAKLLSVSQPALSKSIAGLEEDLGVPLFEKQGRNVKLTEYGKIFATYAASAINEINAGIKDLENTLLKNSQRLLLCVPSGINLFWEGRLIQSFRAQEPDFNIGIYHMGYDRMILALKRNLLDYGLCFEDNIPTDPDIIKIPVGYYPMAALVSSKNALAKQDAVTFAEIAHETIIIPDRGEQEYFMEYLINQTQNTLLPFTAASWEELFAKVAQNNGVYICPAHNNKCIISSESKLLPISDASACKSIYLLCNKYKKITPTMDSFKNFVKKNYKSENCQ